MPMLEQPTITTERLVLRPFTVEDATLVEQLAGHPDVAATTLNIPHPYPSGGAIAWFATQAEDLRTGKAVVFAITLKSDNTLIGAMGLEIQRKHDRAEMGYWIGKPYWNHGYATEAAKAVLDFGFKSLGLHRIHASHFAENVASGRVMQKARMHHEGTMRGRVKKSGRYIDIVIYARLATDPS